MHSTRRGETRASSRRGRRVRARARAAGLVVFVALGACGGGSSPARTAPFFVFDWRVDTGEDAPAGSTASWDIWKDDEDGLPAVQLTSAEPSHVWSFEPTISPDGTTIAFVGVEDGTGYTHILTMRSNGFSTKQVTVGAVHDQDPTWSPRGDRIVFSSDRGGSWSIWTMKVDGTGLWRVTNPPSDSYDERPVYSPDALRVAFQRHVSGGPTDVWVVNAWVGTPARLTSSSGNNMDPAWKPDGSRIAFASDRYGGGYRIFQMAPDGSGQKKTDPLPGLGLDTNHFRPTWSADGSRIWFVARFEPGDLQGDQSIHSMKPDGGDEQEEEGMVLPDELDHPDVNP